MNLKKIKKSASSLGCQWINWVLSYIFLAIDYHWYRWSQNSHHWFRYVCSTREWIGLEPFNGRHPFCLCSHHCFFPCNSKNVYQKLLNFRYQRLRQTTYRFILPIVSDMLMEETCLMFIELDTRYCGFHVFGETCTISNLSKLVNIPIILKYHFHITSVKFCFRSPQTEIIPWINNPKM